MKSVALHSHLHAQIRAFLSLAQMRFADRRAMLAGALSRHAAFNLFVELRRVKLFTPLRRPLDANRILMFCQGHGSSQPTMKTIVIPSEVAAVEGYMKLALQARAGAVRYDGGHALAAGITTWETRPP